jgi:hypothetical protein
MLAIFIEDAKWERWMTLIISVTTVRFLGVIDCDVFN